MPISKKTFDRGFVKKSHKVVNDYVLDFLRSREGRAYKAPEIAKAIKKSGTGVRAKLNSLVKRNLVIRKMIKVPGRITPYYMAKKRNKPSKKKKKR